MALPLKAEATAAQLVFPKEKRIRDKAHLAFVASQPCLVCGRRPAQAHHIRFAQPSALGLKVSDEFTVPLCNGHHIPCITPAMSAPGGRATAFSIH